MTALPLDLDLPHRQPPLAAPRSSATSTSTGTAGSIIFSGFFEPLFYLLEHRVRARGAGRDVPGPGGQPISYQLFVAPALLASAAMNGAISESTFNFFFKLNYNKTFTSILATPLSPGDIAVGELGWALIRGGLYAIGFMVVMVAARAGRLAVGRSSRSRRRCWSGSRSARSGWRRRRS